MAKIKIIVVDDEAVFCRVMEEFLQNEGFEVILAANSEEALSMTKKEKPDIMALDIRMPGINGDKIIRQLKDSYPKMAIVVVSGSDIPDMQNVLERAGADALLLKPMNFEKFLETVQELLAKQGS